MDVVAALALTRQRAGAVAAAEPRVVAREAQLQAGSSRRRMPMMTNRRRGVVVAAVGLPLPAVAAAVAVEKVAAR